MGKILVALLVLTVVHASFAKLQCYICPKVTEECETSEAIATPCVGSDPYCSRQTKIGMKDSLKAIRKCVLPEGKDKKIPCPPNYECHTCNDNLCNSADLVKISQLGLYCAFAAIAFNRLLQ